jgi:CheY-like chemotaxis protein
MNTIMTTKPEPTLPPTQKQFVLIPFDGRVALELDPPMTPTAGTPSSEPAWLPREFIPSSASDRIIKLGPHHSPTPFSDGAREEQGDAGDLDGAHVLVVDDDAAIRESLAKVLRAEGCAVEVAGNGIEGLEKYDPDRTDVVVLDLHMPEMNGWDTYAHIIRANPAQAVILASGEAQLPGWLPVGRSPVFMEKPIRVLTLLRCIRKILVEPAATRRVRVAVQTAFARSTRPHHGPFTVVSDPPRSSGLND